MGNNEMKWKKTFKKGLGGEGCDSGNQPNILSSDVIWCFCWQWC
jgi:hypothetical protein